MAELRPDEHLDKVDGRHERVRAGKIQVYKAVLQLFGEGHVHVSQADLAAKAGISERTLFRYFDSYDDIVAGTISHVYPSLRKYFEAPIPDGDLRVRLIALAELRVEFVKEHGAMARSAEALVPSSKSAQAAKYFRDTLFDEQFVAWVGNDKSRIGATELVIVQNLFSFLSIDSLYSSLGDACIEPVAEMALGAFK